MSKKYAFLFPGQGAQAPGMVKDVAEAFPSAKKVIDDFSSIINVDMAKLMWESDAETLRALNLQPQWDSHLANSLPFTQQECFLLKTLQKSYVSAVS